MTSDLLLDAIVARLQPVGDNDLIVSLLTAERGRVDAWVRAGRKSSRRFGGRLELFRAGVARLRPGRGQMPSLAGFEGARQLLGPGVGYSALCLASYAAELALIAAQPEHADAQLATWLSQALAAVAHADPEAVVTDRLAIEITFLAAAGCMPATADCNHCGAPLAAGAAWPAFADGPLCDGCAPGGHLELGVVTMCALAGLRGGDLSAAHVEPLPAPERDLITARVTGLLHDALPRRPRSADALNALVAP